MDKTNLYAHSAHLYDLAPSVRATSDLPFYRRQAGQVAGSLLELACGTGRLLLPLARDGHTVHGLDLSPTMLDICRGKLAQAEDAVRTRVTLHHASMADFDLGQSFGLIFIAFRSFQSLQTRKEQLGCLAAVRRHLAPGGRFIVNAFKPWGPMDDSWRAPRQTDWEVTDPATGYRVRRDHIRRHIDPEAQIIEVTYIFEVFDEEKQVATVRDELRLAYFFEDQLRALLAECGFEVLEALGGYDGRPVGEGDELIFVCGAASQGE